MQVVQSLTYFI